VELIAIGNGTASRETDRLGAELIQLHPELGLTKMVVSEAGASVYSASAFASQELPDLDVSLRGGVSIARRLQDPLAELVKIDPQSIGVGQYQHDLSELKLSRSLNAVVEDCVNAVGVDVNTASTPLLSRVSGIGEGLARSIVSYREAHGPFLTRAVLKKVPRLGPKAFELSAGFLRIRNGDDPLDAVLISTSSNNSCFSFATTAGLLYGRNRRIFFHDFVTPRHLEWSRHHLATIASQALARGRGHYLGKARQPLGDWLRPKLATKQSKMVAEGDKLARGMCRELALILEARCQAHDQPLDPNNALDDHLLPLVRRAAHMRSQPLPAITIEPSFRQTSELSGTIQSRSVHFVQADRHQTAHLRAPNTHRLSDPLYCRPYHPDIASYL
jgi:competence ComEA-like helix-hairpin-helix protein